MQVKAEVNFIKGAELKPKASNSLELLLFSLANCIAVYANKYLERHTIVFNKLKVKAKADFTTESPARLINIQVKVDTDAQLDDKRAVFLKFIRACPIHNTLLNTKEIDVGLAK